MNLKPYFEETSIRLKQVYSGLIDEVMQSVAVPINPQIEDAYKGSAVLFGPILCFYVKGRGGEEACSIVAYVYCGHEKDVTNGYDVQVGDRLMMFASVGMDVGREFLEVPPSIITVEEGEQWFAELKKKIDEFFTLIASQGPAIADGLNNFERYVEEDRRAAEEERRSRN